MYLTIVVSDELIQAHKGKRVIKGSLYVDNNYNAVYNPWNRQKCPNRPPKALYKTDHGVTKISQENILDLHLRCNLNKEEEWAPTIVRTEAFASSIFVERMTKEI